MQRCSWSMVLLFYFVCRAVRASSTPGCNVQGGKVYTVDLTDKLWLESIQAEEAAMQNCSWTSLTISELIYLAHDTGAIRGFVLYSTAEPWSFATVVTLCGIEKVVPLARTLPGSDGKWLQISATSFMGRLMSFVLWPLKQLLTPTRATAHDKWPVIYNVNGMWHDSFAATAWAFHNLLSLCQDTEQTIAIQTPELMQQGLLADLIVSHGLFAFWLPDMCTPGTPSQALYDNITTPAWLKGQLLTVLGYFPSQEVIATCSSHHTEVTLVSDWSPNLSFLSLTTAVRNLTQPAPLPMPPYDANQTYVAIIASDGDNMQMDYNNKRVRMDERQHICSRPNSVCPPMSWTISNRLQQFSPFVLQWHYRQAFRSMGKDSFLMGPSGYGFLHPSIISSSDPARQEMISCTEAAAIALDMEAYVHWDDYNNALSYATASNTVHGPSPMHSKVQRGHSMQAQCGKLQNHSQAQKHSMPMSNENSLAMEAYIRHFNNSSIHTVFSPIIPYMPDWIGNVATFRELVRWTSAQSVESIASILQALPSGTLGYVYQLPDVDMQSVETLGGLLANANVTLVDHRHLHILALAKLQYNSAGVA